MQYHHRNRLPPPPPPPFGRGGGPGYPRGHTQLYAPPPPLPSMPPAPQRKYEVLMEAGRLAAEYLVSQGVLPPAALQRGTGVWTVPPLPPPPPPQQESPVFYGRRRYEDEYSNNPSARHRRTNGSTSSTSSRDDNSSGSYNGRGKRKYGEYRRGYSDSKNERGRAVSSSRRYEEDEDEDGAPGFQKVRRGSRWSGEVSSSVTETVREEMPLMKKAVGELDKEDTKSKVVSSIEDVQKDADVVPDVDENEEGELDDDSKVLNSESEVVEQATDADTNAGVMELVSNQLPDCKVPSNKAEDSDKISDDTASEDSTLAVEVTNLENNMFGVTPNLLAHCDFAKAPTRPRSVRAHRNAASVSRGTLVAATVDLVSPEQTSQMVIDESAKQSSLSIIKSENGEDQTYRGNNSADPSDEPMLLHENGTSVVTEIIREEKGDEQPQLFQENKEETSLSPFPSCHVDSMPQEDNVMQETDMYPSTACHKDNLPQEDNLISETDLSPVTSSHKENSFMKETKLCPLPVTRNDNLMQQTDLSQAMSSHENNLELQFNEGAQVCDFDAMQQGVDLIELSAKRETIATDLCPNVGTESAIKLEGGLDQSDTLKVSDLDLVDDAEVAALHDNTTLAQPSAAGSSTEPPEKQLEVFGATAGANASASDDFCQHPLGNKDVQLDNIDPKSKNEMMCSSMDNIVHPGLHTDVLPAIQDSYSLSFTDFLDADIPCYPTMQSDLHAGIGANDSEGIAGMDDPIYGSLADIGFMDVWGQPTQDYDKFF